MSFGSGLSEKDAINQLGTRAEEFSDLSDFNRRKSKTAFKFFRNAAKPTLQYYNTLLTGDRDAMTEFLGPEVSAINEAYSAPLRSISELGPRGGGTATAVGNLQEGQARAVGDLFGKVRPMAAQQLGALSGVFGNVAEGFSGQTTKALEGAGQMDLGKLAAISAGRARTSQFWGDIGQAAGNIFGGWLGGKGN